MMSGKDFLKSQPCFELAAKGVFRLGRCYIFWQGIPGLWASNWESTATDGWSLDRWHQKTTGACRTKRLSAGKTKNTVRITHQVVWRSSSLDPVKLRWRQTQPFPLERFHPAPSWWYRQQFVLDSILQQWHHHQWLDYCNYLTATYSHNHLINI